MNVKKAVSGGGPVSTALIARIHVPHSTLTVYYSTAASCPSPNLIFSAHTMTSITCIQSYGSCWGQTLNSARQARQAYYHTHYYTNACQ